MIPLVLCLAIAAVAPTVDDVFLLRSLSEVQVNGDGRRAVFVVGRTDLEADRVESSLWTIDLETGRHVALTSGRFRDERPRWAPDGLRIAFLSDRGGPRTIWVVAAAGGEPRAALPDARDVERFAWLPDGSGFVFTRRDPARAATPARSRLYVQETSGARPLTPADRHVDAFDIARGTDGRTRVALTVQPSADVRDGRFHSDLDILDLQSGEIRSLVRQPGLDRSPRFSPDGLRVAFVSMGGKADWLANYVIAVVGVAGGAARTVTGAFDERVEYHAAESETSFRWATDGTRIYFLGPRGLDHFVWQVSSDGGAVDAVGDPAAAAVVTSFDVRPDGTAIAVSSNSTAPPELTRLLRGTSAPPLTRINAVYPRAGVPATERVQYRAKDGLSIDALVLRSQSPGAGPRPLLVVLHGGPMGVFDDGFEPRRGAYPVHALTAAGYVVFMPNPRGSGGYGEAFRKAAVGEWGLADFDDVERGIDLLVERGVADPARIGIMGWSYGGYLTARAITRTTRFRAASVGAGITNPYSFWGITDIPEFVEAYFGGKPWEPGTKYLDHAPERYVDRVKTPALVQHGEADRRVPIAQGLSFHRALSSLGVETAIVTFPAEGHEIRRPSHVKEALDGNLAWFMRWIPAGTRP